MRFWLLLSMSLLSLHGFSAATLPEGCQALAVQGETIVLSAKQAKLVFIHNLSNNDLWLTHPQKNEGAGAGWTTRMQADNWSALALHSGPFELSCIESRPGHEQAASCAGLVSVCQWRGVKMPKTAQGTFWAAEDLSLQELTAAVGGRGFILPARK